MSSPLSRSLLAASPIYHDRQRNILICRECQHGVSGNVATIDFHLLKNHSDPQTHGDTKFPQLELSNRRALVRELAALSALEPIVYDKDDPLRHSDLLPAESVGYSPDLKVISNGYRCREADCTYASQGGAMANHFRDAHPNIPVHKAPTPICTLFQGKYRHYFPVQIPPTEPTPPSSRSDGGAGPERAEMAFEVALQARRVEYTNPTLQHAVKPNMFLTRMGWPLFFADLDLPGLMQRCPVQNDKDEHVDEQEKWIMKQVDTMIKTAYETIWTRSPLFHRYLYSNSSDASPTPFKRIAESTLVRYGRLWGRLVNFLLRMRHDASDWGLRLPNESFPLLEQLDELSSRAPSDPNTPPTVQSLLFSLSRMLITHPMGGGQLDHPLLYFLGVVGWDRRDSVWIQASTHCPTLSSMIYCIKVIAFQVAMDTAGSRPRIEDGEGDDVSPNPELEELKRFKSRHLDTNSDSVTDELSNLRDYTSVIARDSYSRPHFAWEQNSRETFSWKGEKIALSAIRTWVADLIRRATNTLQYDLVFAPDGQLEHIDLDNVKDELARSTNGQSFREQNPRFAHGEKVVYHNAKQHQVGAKYALALKGAPSDCELRMYLIRPLLDPR